MSEWAKQQGCWNGLKGRKLEYGDAFDSCLTLAEAARGIERDERKKKREIDGINAQAEVVSRGATFWRQILDRGVVAKKLDPKDQEILQICAVMPRQLPTELQSMHAITVLEKMMGQGLVV